MACDPNASWLHGRRKLATEQCSNRNSGNSADGKQGLEETQTDQQQAAHPKDRRKGTYGCLERRQLGQPQRR